MLPRDCLPTLFLQLQGGIFALPSNKEKSVGVGDEYLSLGLIHIAGPVPMREKTSRARKNKKPPILCRSFLNIVYLPSSR